MKQPSPQQKKRQPSDRSKHLPPLAKAPTGIVGLDEITLGGLPRGRPTLVCGAAGCGKTLLGMQFLIRGALDHGEQGVFLAFEERESDLIQNVASLGFDLARMVEQKQIVLDHVHVERQEIEESGEYDLEGLFVRIEHALATVKAKRLVIDTLETIFGGLNNYGILRAELRRLFAWLKERGITTIITAERGEGSLMTRHGLEEYVSDCVIALDHRVQDQVSTRRIRIAKYRGSMHGTNEYPFLIDEHGLTVIPITSSLLNHRVSTERVPTGVSDLDRMLGGGYFRGSTVLISGTAGAGKSSLCAHFALATCSRKQRCIYISYEESPDQIVRNMRSIGLALQDFVDKGLLRILALRPTAHGLEGHLSQIYRVVEEFEPQAVILDPIGTLSSSSGWLDTHLMVVRLVDYLKSRGVTSMMSNLTHGGESAESTAAAISSLVDTWLLVNSIEANGERNRGLYVLKSRGMAHSNQIREFVITNHGIALVEPYIGAEGVLTGTARVSQENRERAALKARAAEVERARRLLARKREVMEQRMAAMRAEFEAEALETGVLLDEFSAAEHDDEVARSDMRARRDGGVPGKPDGARKGPRRSDGQQYNGASS